MTEQVHEPEHEPEPEDEQPSASEENGAAEPSPPGPDSDSHLGPGSDPDPDSDPGARIAELTSDLQRVQAEYVNYKRRVDRDRELVLQNAKFTVLAALLPVLDDVDRARGHGELEGGFRAVAESLERIVSSQGLVKFGAPGDEFDPRRHEALMHGHSPDVTTSTCQDVVQAGYSIGDRVVRPARVTVVDPQPESQPESEPESQPESQPDPHPGHLPGHLQDPAAG